MAKKKQIEGLKQVVVKKVDPKLWRKFGGLCKIMDQDNGERINILIKRDLEENNIPLE